MLLSRLNDAVWSPWLLGLFLAAGLYYSLRTGFFQLFRIPLWLRTTFGAMLRRRGRGNGRGISQFQALATALASTIGTGSIAGVATAIWFGGPGAVFWMWVSALLGMMTGCAEKLLSVRYRRAGPAGWLGGPMYYIRDGLKSPLLAGWFALACLPATLTGGDMVQSSSIAAALQATFGWDRLAVGAAVAVLTGLVMVGGIGRIARVSSGLVPAMALLYLGGGAAVLAARADQIPEAMALIFCSALRPEAAVGGGMGYTLAAALRYGVARGVFTNEAGLGTSAMTHAAAEVDCPARQGMWGIVEVCVSTLLVCTATALVILVSGVYGPADALVRGALGAVPPDRLGAPLTAAAFSSVLGPWGGAVVSLSLLLFAFSSILGWSWYGEQSILYLTGSRRLVPAYRLVFLSCVVLGSVWEGEAVWELVDLCNALMAIPNLTALLLLSPQVLRELRDWERTGG